MDDLETSSYIQPKIDTHIRVDVPTSVLAQFPGLQQTKKYFPILPLVWSLPAFPFYIFQMQTFCRCPGSLQQVWNMERVPVCLVLMDHFVKISSFRYVLSACWLSCSLLVSVFLFPSLCFLFVDDCWLVIAFSLTFIMNCFTTVSFICRFPVRQRQFFLKMLCFEWTLTFLLRLLLSYPDVHWSLLLVHV